MKHYRNASAVWLNIAILAVLVGCGKGKNDSPTAAMSGSDGKSVAAEDSQAAAQKDAFDKLHPVVVFDTSLGEITIQLDAERSGLTVGNFLHYVETGHYDQTIVHQVYQGQGFLAGGYGPDFVEKRPTKDAVRNEARNLLKNTRGTISMVRVPDSIDSATCQFFINVADNPELDHRDDTPEGYGYCVFGTVTKGMDVVDKIAAAEVRHDVADFDNTPKQTIVIQSAKIAR